MKLYYELRQLKKNNSQIASVFSLHGNLKCKLVNGKVFLVNNGKDLEVLKEKITAQVDTTLQTEVVAENL